MNTASGEPAMSQLEKLEQDLQIQRTKAIETGAVDREWFQKTVRRVVEWVPETDLALIAALGQIIRSGAK